MSETFDKAYWDEHYDGHAPAAAGPPNPYLTAAAGDLTPGTALDAGCGEGAEAIWLATHGWQVTAVDIADTALRRAREHAAASGVTTGIDWIQADLTTWTPAEERFDLACSHYAHPATGPGDLFRRLAAAVAPGGTLLVVGHHPSDPHTAAVPEAHVEAGELTAALDPGRWDITVAENRSRVMSHGDREMPLHDTVLQARKRR
ncbi:class I SAM-dependent methyltransferase [Nonomuraea sp. MCN248]|uniref:Class I SAM-dependent methyltransferase n=1 Tax=Nonomuraea corallina TaxID=2989783 RepID=A0ABT4S7C0_9ACTN|nr:class I SAM-dependent methyltransferase [Nonomuraea corallina]MDA0632958.1 class I SAM-dependent methyltransferase [Nonomuraea corallina]